MSITFPALTEVEGKIKNRQQELASIFDEAGADIDLSQVKSVDGGKDAVLDRIRALNEELEELGNERDSLRQVQKASEHARRNGEGETESGDTHETEDRKVKSVGDLFVESKAFTDRQGSTGPVANLDIGLKALFDTTGWAPESVRGPRLVLDEQRPIQVVDLIPQTTTSQAAIKYMEETTFTNAAAETAEGAAKPEAALALTERTSDVRKIAVWIPVTDETFEDVPRARDYVNNRLPFMVRQRLDLQIISGNGTAPNLRGILNVTGIQTQAKGTDPTPDAVYKAITKVEVTGQAMPDAAIFHPNDWQDVRLLRTSDGVYIWGNPSEAGPERIWGLRVVKAQAATENTAIVGDFGNFSELAVRSGINVQVSSEHSTFFTENKLAVRAEMRAAFIVYRPTAFCSVTGI